MIRFVLACCVLVEVLDVAMATTSKASGIPYAWFIVVSATFYLAVGLFARRRFSLGSAFLPGVAAALVDATMGWVSAWLIGPGALTGASIPTIVTGVIFAVIFGAFFAALGVALGSIGRKANAA